MDPDRVDPDHEQLDHRVPESIERALASVEQALENVREALGSVPAKEPSAEQPTVEDKEAAEADKPEVMAEQVPEVDLVSGEQDSVRESATVVHEDQAAFDDSGSQVCSGAGPGPER